MTRTHVSHNEHGRDLGEARSGLGYLGQQVPRRAGEHQINAVEDTVHEGARETIWESFNNERSFMRFRLGTCRLVQETVDTKYLEIIKFETTTRVTVKEESRLQYDQQ